MIMLQLLPLLLKYQLVLNKLQAEARSECAIASKCLVCFSVKLESLAKLHDRAYSGSMDVDWTIYQNTS